MTDCSLPRVWIIGSSLIARLQAHLGAFGLDQNLGLDWQITWACRGGRRWEHLMPLLRSKRADIHDDPDVMVIHLGGNSIGTYGNTRISLMRRMKTDIREIDLLFPKTKLMFSDILPRSNWRGQTATTGYGLERTRRRLNGAMFGFLSDMGIIPKAWRESKVIAILKPGKPAYDPASYRPISLLCTSYKLFERLLLARISPLVEPVLPREQAGFRPGRSCTDQVIALTTNIASNVL
ncbi:hypothetical protein SKAU_G00252180 [Synaphobranchus kaupii]|uniref:Reverse transcriptase domain-containing protein n=1 Tax=Synaphobranchus kaupii TaxID=118154 RepID=A0A9Q1F334_SYNKA|nr:hypothetical protein SKAU_G00252180 [Synaphobranchus kaupii]